VFWQESSSKALPCKVFVESAKITFGTFCSTKSRPRQKKSEDKPWFNVD
jgi:hypothetical protein